VFSRCFRISRFLLDVRAQKGFEIFVKKYNRFGAIPPLLILLQKCYDSVYFDVLSSYFRVYSAFPHDVFATCFRRYFRCSSVRFRVCSTFPHFSIFPRCPSPKHFGNSAEKIERRLPPTPPINYTDTYTAMFCNSL
jgi:hypothetical protein